MTDKKYKPGSLLSEPKTLSIRQGQLERAFKRYEENMLNPFPSLPSFLRHWSYEGLLSTRRRWYEQQQTPQSEEEYKFFVKKVSYMIFDGAAQVEYHYSAKSTSIPQLYSSDMLSGKQLQNIQKYCAKELGREDIIVFCGTKCHNNNGKRGYVFTFKGIYADASVYKNIKGEKIDLPIPYAELEKCEYEEQEPGHLKCIFKDGRQMYIYTGKYSHFFCQVVNQMVDIFSF